MKQKPRAESKCLCSLGENINIINKNTCHQTELNIKCNDNCLHRSTGMNE